MIFRPQFWLLVLVVSTSSTLAMASGFSLADSVGVERVGDKSFILHQVEAKETLFGISRRYQSPVGEIVEANPTLKQGLKIGQTIKVPFIPKSDLPAGTILHKVVPGETLFSISKKYGVSVDEVKSGNELKGNDLSVGQALIIKGSTVAADANATPVIAQQVETPAETVKTGTAKLPKKEEKVKEAPKSEVIVQPAPRTDSSRPAVTETKVENKVPMVRGEWMSHTVKSGETLFSVANQYNARVEDLITWNALSSNNVREGQTLKVGRGPAEPSKVPVVGNPKVVSSVEEMNKTSDIENTSGGFKNIRETGQAELIEGTGGHKKYLVLHRTAPVGTIMRVKNEENDVTIFARVVGTLPETGDNGRLVIKLSQAAFDQLKAVNGRFPVEVMY